MVITKITDAIPLEPMVAPDMNALDVLGRQRQGQDEFPLEETTKGVRPARECAYSVDDKGWVSKDSRKVGRIYHEEVANEGGVRQRAVFRRRARSSTQLLRNSDSWAFDSDLIDELRRVRVHRIEIEDEDSPDSPAVEVRLDEFCREAREVTIKGKRQLSLSRSAWKPVPGASAALEMFGPRPTASVAQQAPASKVGSTGKAEPKERFIRLPQRFVSSLVFDARGRVFLSLLFAIQVEFETEGGRVGLVGTLRNPVTKLARLAAHVGISDSQVSRYVTRWHEAGVIRLHNTGHGLVILVPNSPCKFPIKTSRGTRLVYEANEFHKLLRQYPGLKEPQWLSQL
jgi:hypothetical protein